MAGNTDKSQSKAEKKQPSAETLKWIEAAKETNQRRRRHRQGKIDWPD